MTANARSGVSNDRPAAPAPPPPPAWRRYLIPVGVVITLGLLFVPRMGSEPEKVDYGRLAQQVAAKHVDTLVLSADGARLHFRNDLPVTLDEAQAALERLLARIDMYADMVGAPTDLAGASLIMLPAAPTTINLAAEGIRTVVWTTGFHRDYSWLHVPVLNAGREIMHEGGVTPAPGLYVLGLRFMRRRRSTFIDGVGRDAEELSAHLARYLAGRLQQAA